jgi:hypothetical protein
MTSVRDNRRLYCNHKAAEVRLHLCTEIYLLKKHFKQELTSFSIAFQIYEAPYQIRKNMVITLHKLLDTKSQVFNDFF